MNERDEIKDKWAAAVTRMTRADYRAQALSPVRAGRSEDFRPGLIEGTDPEYESALSEFEAAQEEEQRMWRALHPEGGAL